MDAFKILVIILSVVFSILLVCSIVLVVKLTQLVNYLKRISARADAVMEDVESVGEFFKRSAGPMALGRLIGSLVENFGSNKSKKGKR